MDGGRAPLVLAGHGDAVLSVGFSPDGRRIVSASYDRTVRVWNATSGLALLALRGTHRFWSAGFSPDGARIAAGSEDGRIRIWSADGRGVPVVLTGHTGAVLGVHFSPDGTGLVSASEDLSVRVWRDLAPASLDDPRLWSRTSYCVPVELRRELLGVSEAVAREGFERCRERVAASRAAAR